MFRGVDSVLRTSPENVVRVERLEMYAHLRYLSAHRTQITYRVDIDPGGSVPHWVVRWIVKRLPLRTLMRLRKQISATRGQYEAFLARHDPARKRSAPK